MNIREVILDILLEWEEGNVFSHILLQNVLQKYDYLDSRDKAFIKKVTQGTIEQKIYLDYVLDQFSKVPVHKMKKVIRAVMRMSVYQLLFMDSVPDSAVCNEAVKLAAKRKFVSLKGFVNGVLRQVARSKDEIVLPDVKKDPIQYYSVKYSMPTFLTERFLSWYGEETEAIFAAFLKEKPVCIRFSANCAEKERQELISAWEKKGALVQKHPYLEYAYLLEKTEGVASLEGYEEGMFTVQDVSSMLVGEIADIKPGMQVIDCCAAPGGKTLHAAEKTGKDGLVKAFDVSDRKLDKIQENVERMGLTNVLVDLQDASEYVSDLEQSADVVLCDVPCSGLGVMGKKQDIKYRIDETALLQITDLQKSILNNVWNYVKVGGTFIYSTCTMNPEENEKMISWIEQNLPLVREPIAGYLPEELKGSVKDDTLQLRPGIHQCDGFFMARLKRK